MDGWMDFVLKASVNINDTHMITDAAEICQGRVSYF